MKVNEELLHKNGLAALRLAQEIGRFRPGDRLPRINDLAGRLKLSVGTTQCGLSFLRDKNLVCLTVRGHLGTFVDSVDYAALQEFLGQTAKAFVMPLPYSRRYEGLATAFSRLGSLRGESRLYLAFMNGSGRRIAALMEGRYDAALLSRAAALHLIRKGAAIRIAACYGPGSFLEKHVLLHRFKNPGNIQTLGMDRESLDQVLLAKSFLKNHPGVKVRNLPYSHIIDHLTSGGVDGAVWNLDYIREHHPPLYHSPLEPAAGEQTEAVLAIRADDMITEDFITRRLRVEKVRQTQAAVLRGSRLPEY
ncbi:MAG: hypothetical protein LBQ61_01860 [Spirochaetales bacterium]|jgi:hypothetical protein|nr:hypothetical protein [Spirochaetales bacterium]